MTTARPGGDGRWIAALAGILIGTMFWLLTWTDFTINTPLEIRLILRTLPSYWIIVIASALSCVTIPAALLALTVNIIIASNRPRPPG